MPISRAVLVCATLIGSSATIASARADALSDFFGGGFFGAPQPQPQPQAPPRTKPQATPRRRSGGGVSYDFRRRRHKPKADADSELGNVGRTSHTAHKSDEGDGAFASGHHSICVRLCDGYPFPVGDYRGEEDRASHEATCHTECPGAQTALYLMSGDRIEDSIRVGSREKYSKLPAALKYRDGVSPTCSCHPASGSRVASLLHDFTLRRGDAVMTKSGLRIFHGDTRFPFKQQDFVTFGRSHDISKSDRAILAAIERSHSTGAVMPFVAVKDTDSPADRPLTVLLNRKARN